MTANPLREAAGAANGLLEKAGAVEAPAQPYSGFLEAGPAKPQDLVVSVVSASPSSEIGEIKAAQPTAEAMRDAVGKIFGTKEPFQAEALLGHCMAVLHPEERGKAGEDNNQLPFMFSIVQDLAPRDAVERMLAVHMAATHVALIRAGSRLAKADTLPQCEAHTTGYTKLARIFTAQVEALQKHRRGGQQTVVVQHVTVADGGQAIVGHVETAARNRGVGG